MSDAPKEEAKSPFSSADRPLECSECKKSIAVCYTLVEGESITHTVMCADCPQLQMRLHGNPKQPPCEGTARGKTGLCCGECGSTLDEVKMGSDVGCSQCYEVFGDLLIKDLAESNKVSKRIRGSKQGKVSHIGRAPGESKEIGPSVQLKALNEALNETLRREDYEQAAWLRDQIKELTEKGNGKEKQ